MKTKLIISILFISILNVTAAFLIEDKVVFIFASLIATTGGVYMLYKWMLSPIAQMRRKLKKIEEKNTRIETMRKEFVANVSHELKTPLTSISGFIETLQAGAAEDPEARNKFIEIIAIETARLKRLIQDILILSDIESKIETSSVVFRVEDIIEDVAFLLEPIANNRNIKITTIYESDVKLEGNEDKFKQMIVNLAENAIKYSNENSEVVIKVSKDEENIYISVIDQGIGIAEEDLSRISERFYRVDKSRSNKVGGTGLGLSIVKHTASLFGGKLEIESKLGEGSTFTVVIPTDNK